MSSDRLDPIIHAVNGTVRSFIEVAFTLALIALAFLGKISGAEFLGIAGFVLGYLFRPVEKKAG